MPRFHLLVVFLLLMPLPAEAERLLTVSGQGRVAAVPDMATITLGVTEEASTAGEAMDQVSTAVASVLEELSAAGIEPRDLQTSELSLWPVYDRQSSTRSETDIRGFRASNQVTIRVRDLERLGALLDVVVERGANTFQGLSFGLQEPGPAQDEARRRAVADAMARAQLYAEAAGVALGPLVSLDEGGGVMPRAPMLERSVAAAEAVPVAEGEVESMASVTLVFEIVDPAE